MRRRWLLALAVGLLLGGDAPKRGARVGQIVIVGNVKTPQSIILRHLSLYPGQVLEYPLLKEAERNLARLNRFKGKPTVSALPGDPGNPYLDILVKVVERDGDAPLMPPISGVPTRVEQNEKEKLLGEWRVQAVEAPGNEDVNQSWAKGTLLFTAKRVVLISDDYALAGSYRLDPTKEPKAIDFKLQSSEKAFGIYEMHGNSLRICWTDAAGRPTSFPTKRNADRMAVLITLKREKP